MADAPHARSVPGATDTVKEQDANTDRFFAAQGFGNGGAADAEAGLGVKTDMAYRSAFVEAMQKQHQARLQEANAAAERLLSSKEMELNDMALRLRVMGDEAAARERSLSTELVALTEQLAQCKSASEVAAREQAAKFEAELADLKAIRSSELSELKRRHEDEVDELRAACGARSLMRNPFFRRARNVCDQPASCSRHCRVAHR
eukprot:SAG11_NODE_107_length_16392_cov_18.393666_5_plen_204_part_00